MSEYVYLDNAFWEDGIDDRSQVKCIKVTTMPDGKRRNDVMLYHRLLPSGRECSNYKEVVEKIGIEKIDKNTEERRERKLREREEQHAIREQERQAAELENLFGLKLRAFEVDEIKNSDDRVLRTKLRRAKNEVEMMAIASLIMGKELGVFGNGTTD